MKCENCLEKTDDIKMVNPFETNRLMGLKCCKKCRKEYGVNKK